MNESGVTTEVAPVRPPRPAEALRVAVLIWAVAALFVYAALRNAPTPATSVAATVAYEGPDRRAWLGDAAVQMISAGLDGAGSVRAVAPTWARARLGRELPARFSADSARAAARFLGVSHLVHGSLTVTDDSVRLEIFLREAEGPRSRRIVDARPRGEFGSMMFDATLALAGRLRGAGVADLVEDARSPGSPVADEGEDAPDSGFPGAGGGARSSAREGEPGVAAGAASSNLGGFSTVPGALEAYFRAERSFRAGRFSQAGALYDRALRADPGFTLAAFGGARSALEIDRPALARAYLGRADASVLGPRLRYRVEGLRHWLDGDAVAAHEALEAATTRYPEDLDAWRALTELRYHTASFTAAGLAPAGEAARRVLDLAPSDDLAARVAIMAAAAEGDTAALDAFIVDHRDGTAAEARWAATALATAAATPRKAMAPVEQLALPQRAPGQRAEAEVWRAYLLLAGGQRAAADEAFDRAAALDPDLALEHRALAYTLPFLAYDATAAARLARTVRRWRPAGARTQEDAVDHYRLHLRGRSLFAPYLDGLLRLRAGEVATAQSRADELGDLPWDSAAPPLRAALHASLLAELAAAAGDTARALEILEAPYDAMAFQHEQPSVLVSLARARWQRAEYLRALGRQEAAQIWYDAYWAPLPAVVFLAPSLYRRAQLREEAGDTGGAAADYARFVALWRDADAPLQAWVRDARRRLEALGRP